MDNYGWSALGLTGNDKMAFGVLLLGPGIAYPPTSSQQNQNRFHRRSFSAGPTP